MMLVDLYFALTFCSFASASVYFNDHFNVNCELIECPKINICIEPQQEIVDNIWIGGCCPGCVYISGLNESCNSFESRCRNGLICDESELICVQNGTTSKCIQQREKAINLNGKSFCSNRAGILVKTGFLFETSEYQPECDYETGQYKPKQCKTSKCYCVDPDSGEKTFGTVESVNGSNMTCSCSVALSRYTSDPDNYLDYQSSRHLHCSENGNFASLQCHDQLCFCADPSTGQQVSPLVLIDAVSSLSCYYDTYQRQVEVNCDEKVEYTDDDGNKKLKDLCYCIDHDSGQKWKMIKADLKVCFDYIESLHLIGADYNKMCEQLLQPLANLTSFLGRKGIDAIGLNSMQCDLDGNFVHRQCTDSECSCVNSVGENVANYRIDRYGNDDRTMKCDCAIQEYEITTLGKPYDKLLCDLYGNFKANQCFESGSRCFCVDSNGNRISNVISSSVIPSSLSLSEICSTMRAILEADEQSSKSSYTYQAC
ncbi:uncharacterized protein LOC107370279 [Tetranychus urticae]|uniref:Thyroglobulin type-1 domain-containing protein n=1 Tax=Tetranychus urticae TaxID=32264 RepID=T1L4Q7_TETUR|nr:uncharacterized protein LOC107370279 [Tetranychus urticae]